MTTAAAPFLRLPNQSLPLATATAALVGLALYGNRVPQLSRAALRPSKA